MTSTCCNHSQNRQTSIHASVLIINFSVTLFDVPLGNLSENVPSTCLRSFYAFNFFSGMDLMQFIIFIYSSYFSHHFFGINFIILGINSFKIHFPSADQRTKEVIRQKICDKSYFSSCEGQSFSESSTFGPISLTIELLCKACGDSQLVLIDEQI